MVLANMRTLLIELYATPFLVVTYNSTVIDALALDMKLPVELLGSVHTIIYEISLHWHYFNHVTPLKPQLGHDGLLRCKGVDDSNWYSWRLHHRR